jgi:membrane-bound metal-dependent hydrolase YbcI (DUF457 family)
LVLRKWIDIPVFVLANVIIDLEVLTIMVFRLGWPTHRYLHTLLFGALVGAIWGVVAYPLRHLFARTMRLFRLSYRPTLRKMVISGMLGACTHILIDGAYHHDATVFWPNTTISLWKILRQYITREQGRIICIALLIAAIVYVAALMASANNPERNKTKNTGKQP